MRHLHRSVLALGAVLLLAACDSPSDGGRRDPARLDVVSGDLQAQATAGAELPAPLVARVLDDRGRPVRGQLVNFVVTAGGGSVFAGSALTDRDGEARERWTLGTVAGDTQRVEARAVNAAGQPIVFATFRAVARPGAPSVVERVTPAAVAGAAGAPLDSLSVRVKDQYGNGVPGVSVAWSVVRGGGAVSPATSATGANGVARTAWTLGLRLDSTQVARATVGGSSLDFEAAAFIPTNAVVTKVSGDNQTAVNGTAFAVPFALRVTTASGQPIRGARVRWPNTGADSLTDVNGESRVTLTAGTAPGTQAIFADVWGVGPVGFTVTVVDPSLSAVTSVPGTALDFRGGRLLWVDAAGTLRVRAGGADETVAAGVAAPSHARLYPGGAVYISGGQLYDWRGGGAPVALGAADSAATRMDGSWLAWRAGANVITLRNLASGANEAQVTGGTFDVGPNGNLVYTTGGDMVLRRRDAGTTTTLTSLVSILDVRTDGINVAYTRFEIASQTAFIRVNAAGEQREVLRVSRSDITIGAAGGWAAAAVGGSIVTLSPAGDSRGVAVGGTAVSPVLLDVSTAGDVIYQGPDGAGGGTARFFLAVGSNTPTRIGGVAGRAFFDGTTAYVLNGGTVYRLG